MKSTFVSLVLASGLVAAQLDQLGSIPPCAFKCVTSFVSGNNIADCKPADIACVCNNKSFIERISCCLGEKNADGSGGCSQADIETTIKFAAGICNAAGVQVPTALVCSTSQSSTGSTSPTQTGSNVTTGSTSTTQAPSGTGTSVTTNPASTSSKAAAAQVVGNAGGIIGAALAIVAAL